MFLHTVKNVEGCRNGSAQSKVQHGREWHATITRVIIVYVKGVGMTVPKTIETRAQRQG